MSRKYAVVLTSSNVLPDRELLIRQAWGDVPVSYFQDHESFSDCRFLDVKINKWEMNSQWSNHPDGEPWIRIEILKAQELTQYLQDIGWRFPVELVPEVLVVLYLEEGGDNVDELLLKRLTSELSGCGKVYRWANGFQEVDDVFFASLPSQHCIHRKIYEGF